MSFRYSPGYDPRTIDGSKAVTTQPFTELNSKRGVQYVASFFIPSLATGGIADLAFQVGDDPVLLKDIQTQFNSELVSIQFFKSPVGVSGGTPVVIYNMNDANAVSPTSTITSGVSVTSPGVAIGPREYSIGTENIGNRAVSTSTKGEGVERILDAGETYLFRLINEDTTNPSVISSLATWYQGPLSVNL